MERFQSIVSKWKLAVVLIVIIGVITWGIQWAVLSRPPLPEAIEALASDELVTVTTEPWLTFAPAQASPDTGFIFYPGGRINPRGYAPLMRQIASSGYLVVVPDMLLNLAPFSPNRADDVIAHFTEIDRWVIGGHSVGGTMAARYTDQHRESIAGLAIWASYPMDSTDISDLEIPVVSIYGGNEVRVNDTSVGERKHLLPADTVYYRIEGGDHHQFGSYEIEPKEHLATTGRTSQQLQIVQTTLGLLDAVSSTK